jgi:hypothetical protein
MEKIKKIFVWALIIATSIAFAVLVSLICYFEISPFVN